MWGPYVVIRVGSFSRHAFDMPSICEYYNLYGFKVAAYQLIWQEVDMCRCERKFESTAFG